MGKLICLFLVSSFSDSADFLTPPAPHQCCSSCYHQITEVEEQTLRTWYVAGTNRSCHNRLSPHAYTLFYHYKDQECNVVNMINVTVWPRHVYREHPTRLRVRCSSFTPLISSPQNRETSSKGASFTLSRAVSGVFTGTNLGAIWDEYQRHASVQDGNTLKITWLYISDTSYRLHTIVQNDEEDYEHPIPSPLSRSFSFTSPVTWRGYATTPSQPNSAIRLVQATSYEISHNTHILCIISWTILWTRPMWQWPRQSYSIKFRKCWENPARPRVPYSFLSFILSFSLQHSSEAM